MLTRINKELNITVMNLETQPNNYYIAYNGDSKCVIDTMYTDNGDVVLKCIPQEHCTVDELNVIIDNFSNYIFEIKPDLNGILINMDSNPLLESIGFYELSEESNFLYRKNKRKVK